MRGALYRTRCRTQWLNLLLPTRLFFELQPLLLLQLRALLLFEALLLQALLLIYLLRLLQSLLFGETLLPLLGLLPQFRFALLLQLLIALAEDIRSERMRRGLLRLLRSRRLQ